MDRVFQWCEEESGGMATGEQGGGRIIYNVVQEIGQQWNRGYKWEGMKAYRQDFTLGDQPPFLLHTGEMVDLVRDSGSNDFRFESKNRGLKK